MASQASQQPQQEQQQVQQQGQQQQEQQPFVGTTEAELRSWLEAAGISTGGWGSGASKSVAFLLAEVQEGESTLALEGPSGRPTRRVAVLNVVIRNSEGRLLTEAAQVLPSGSRRPRNMPLSEKLLPGEESNLDVAVCRAIQEELGPVLPQQPQVSVALASYRQEVETRESQSYPGLVSTYVCHRIEAAVEGLPQGDFTTEEDRADGLLVHVWEWR